MIADLAQMCTSYAVVLCMVAVSVVLVAVAFGLLWNIYICKKITDRMK